MTAVWVALIVATASMTGPLLLAHYTNAQRRKERVEDLKRQDDVAEKVADAATLLAETSDKTNHKLDVIHTLVNSNMTAAMQAELEATTLQLAGMKEIVSLRKTLGHEPTIEALAAITAIERRIDELHAKLEDRLEQTKSVS